MSLLLGASQSDATVAELVALSAQNIYACYQCGKCTADCPFSLAPQRVMRFLQLGQVESAFALDTVWQCASCFTCSAACPKGLDPARVIRAMRVMSLDSQAPPHASANVDGAEKHRFQGVAPQTHGRPLRSRLFADIHRLSRAGSALAPFSNWLLALPLAKLTSHYLLGIHKARSFLPFARRSFPAWFHQHAPQGNGHRGSVLLFHDTFMDYNVPQVGVATTELLERAGFRVELAENVCCGRPMLSKGFFPMAEAQARVNLARLYEQARQGTFIVGCEPSCLLTLRDEYPDLVREPALKEQARVVARQALLLDEFLAMLSADGELELTFRGNQNGSRPVLFHGHCHQKALASAANSVKLLQLAGYQAELINAACCGMAGSYGFEAEHYEVSRAAAERGLLPSLRAQPDAEVVVMGVSCRQQIEHFANREPRHLAEALRDALV